MRRIIAFIVIIIAFCSCANAEIHAINAEKSCVVTDSSGNPVFDCSEYDIIFPLKNEEGIITGYAAGILTQYKSVSYALLSPKGVRLTGYSYTFIESAANGFIACSRDRWYCLNSRGIIVSQGYSDIEYAKNRSAFALTGDPYDEISDDLIILFADGSTYETDIKVQYGLGEFSEGLIPLVSGKNLLTGYVDINGTWALEPAYKYAAPFKDGRAVVAGEHGYGVIDASGREIVSPVYSHISYSDGHFCCISDDTAFITDTDGKILSETSLEGGSAVFDNGHLIISYPNSVRVLNASGSVLFEHTGLVSIVPAGGRFIMRREDSLFTVLDDSGEVLTDAYDAIIHLEDDMFAFGKKDASDNHKYGLLSLSRGKIAECMYDSIAMMQSGIYAAESRGSIFLLHKDGHIVRVN